ncbi:MAG: hypothetical protein J5I94_02665 [Phaeodactylibacter sp.]|nr:hypothetical protein [Phaeodactylibacter sp.]
MKKALTLLLLTGAVTALSAQVKLGLRMGMGTTQANTNEIHVPEPGGGDFLNINVQDLYFGIHGGLVLQARLGSFLIQPELLFNSNRVDYRVEDLRGSTVETFIRTEKYQKLDIPFLLGYQAKPFRFHAGPVAHIFIDSSSELFDFPGYEQKFEQATYGWVAGIGLDLWNLMLDVRYEGNFSKFGDHITFNGQQFAFDNNPSRILLSLGILFGKK